MRRRSHCVAATAPGVYVVERAHHDDRAVGADDDCGTRHDVCPGGGTTPGHADDQSIRFVFAPGCAHGSQEQDCLQ